MEAEKIQRPHANTSQVKILFKSFSFFVEEDFALSPLKP